MDNQDLGILGRVRLSIEVGDFLDRLYKQDGDRLRAAFRPVLESFARMCYQIGRIDGYEEGAALASDLRGGGGVASQGSAPAPAGDS